MGLLKVYKSFSEWCSTPEVASAAQVLYGDIDKLELYVGVVFSQAILCVSYVNHLLAWSSRRGHFERRRLLSWQDHG